MKAFLHIGNPKTGTTTIQDFLTKNRQQLLEDGYYYPTSPGSLNQIKLPIFAMKNTRIQDIHRLCGLTKPEQVIKFQSQFQKKLEKELNAINSKAVIFSSEHCSSRLIFLEEIERLKKLLNHYFEEIEIIIYLRRQDKYLVSLYSTAIMGGVTTPLYLPSKDVIKNRYNYYNILKKWEAVFGKSAIKVRVFEREQLLNRDLLEDFMDALGIRLDTRYQFSSNLNQSLDIFSLEYLRMINLFFNPSRQDQKNNSIPKKITPYLINYSRKSSHKTNLLLSKAMAQDFMSHFLESNQQVAQEYLNRLDGQLFNDDFTDLRDKKISQIIFAKKFLEITAFVLKEKLKK